MWHGGRERSDGFGGGRKHCARRAIWLLSGEVGKEIVSLVKEVEQSMLRNWDWCMNLGHLDAVLCSVACEYQSNSNALQG